MMLCKDCVHYEVCKDYVESALDGLQYNDSQMNGDDCEFFKDRSHFVELPCLPGDKVFYFDTDERIYVQTVESLIYSLTKTGFVINSEVDFISDLLGERFFLSYEEAEQALKEREENA